MTQDYVTVKIPVDLADRVDDVLKRLGYSSRAEFTKDAVRRLLVEYGVLQTDENESQSR